MKCPKCNHVFVPTYHELSAESINTHHTIRILILIVAAILLSLILSITYYQVYSISPGAARTQDHQRWSLELNAMRQYINDAKHRMDH